MSSPRRFFALLCAMVSVASAQAAIDIMEVDAAKKVITIETNSRTDVVRYTLDGRDPDFSSGVYLAPIELPEGGTVKAAVFVEQKRVGAVVSKSLPVNPSELPNSAEVPVTQNRDHRTYDWVERHNAILALNKPGASAAKVVFIGDSITHFWSGEPKSTRVAGALTWEKYIAPHAPINLGYGWDRTENVLWRLRHGEVKGLAPKAYVVLIGTNNLNTNTVAETVEGIEAVCAEIRLKSPGAKILLLGLLPRSERPDAMRQKASEVNAMLVTRAPKISDRYMDLSARYIQPDGRITRAIMSDFLHPTDAGYEFMGRAIDDALKAWGL
jgi:lysophospholipase L1-like esterase